MPPRAPTAYFIFAGEVREAVQREVAEANQGKAPGALVGKAIGERWARLSEEEKQKYKELSAQKARELKEAAAAAEVERDGEHAQEINGEDDRSGVPQQGAAEEGGSGRPSLPPFGLPTSLVKKLAVMDPEVRRIKAEGSQALAKATQLFLELLAQSAYEHAVGQKRKNFKFLDILAVSKRDVRLLDMGLPGFLEQDAVFAEIHERLQAEAEARTAKRPALGTRDGKAKDAENTRPLTTFFAPDGKQVSEHVSDQEPIQAVLVETDQNRTTSSL